MRGSSAFHRRELGHPEVTDSGLLSLCHAYNFDLRTARQQGFTPYDATIGTVLGQISSNIAGRLTNLDVGHMDVLHQLSKIMVSPRKSAKLALHVVTTAGIPEKRIPCGRQALELRPVAERHHILQLFCWLMSSTSERIRSAWLANAMRYSDLVRDFEDAPRWYVDLVAEFNRGNSGVRSNTRRPI